MQLLPDFLAKVVPPHTPALVIRRAALEANLAAMQGACNAAGVRLRAHGKMHKCSTLGRLQVAGGAVGLCCQTVGEAESYAAAGIADLLVTAPVPPWGWARLTALPGTIAAVVDSPAQVALAADTGLTLFVDINLGQNRAGVTPETALALAQVIASTRGVSFGGIQAYCGHLQHMTDRDARRTAHAKATARLAAVVADFVATGLTPPHVTGGGTGTYALDLAAGVFTEIQAGSYALMDVDYGVAGAPAGDWPFQPALFVAASVVSVQHAALVTCDAGLKALYTDGPAPRVVAGAARGSRWRSMGDEHGAIIHPDFIERLRHDAIDAIDAIADWPGDAPAEGALIWLQPGHVDPTVALHDAFLVADEAGKFERWPIDGRRTT
jgi:D-serine deaminase-like pyridoxal phosphate-dependent protein